MRAHPAVWKKVRIFSRFAMGRPVWCTWQVTYRCNFRCAFCDYWKGGVDPSRELAPAEIERGARNLARISSLMISIGGGEPFLRDDLPEIIAAMARWHMPLVTTNGWRVTAENARAAFRAGLWGASVSLDYADPGRHDRARGVEHDRRAGVPRFDEAAALDHGEFLDLEDVIGLAIALSKRNAIGVLAVLGELHYAPGGRGRVLQTAVAPLDRGEGGILAVFREPHNTLRRFAGVLEPSVVALNRHAFAVLAVLRELHYSLRHGACVL